MGQIKRIALTGALVVAALAGTYIWGRADGYREGRKDGLNAPWHYVEDTANRIVNRFLVNRLVKKHSIADARTPQYELRAGGRTKRWDYSYITNEISIQAKDLSGKNLGWPADDLESDAQQLNRCNRLLSDLDFVLRIEERRESTIWPVSRLRAFFE